MDFTQNLFLGIIDPEGITHTMFIALYLIPQRSKVDNIRIISDPQQDICRTGVESLWHTKEHIIHNYKS